MVARYFFALLAFVALEEYCLSAPTVEDDEISRRYIQDPRRVYQKLKISFLRMAKEMPTQYGYRRPRPRLDPSKLDIVFMMDRSSSIGQQNFDILKQFVADLIEFFPVFPAKTRIAVVSYSTNVKLEFNFKRYVNRECTQKAIKNIAYTGGLTATGEALEYVRTNLIINQTAGARSDARKVIFILTDGISRYSQLIPAYNLKRQGVTIFAMGVTTSYRKTKLLIRMSSRSSFVFRVNTYSALYEVTRLLEADISNRCYYGQTVYDQCGRRCKCVRGKLVHCCRLRKEFTDMTTVERIRYVNTVKTASTNPLYKQRYETLLTSHKTMFFSDIHELDFFLPWHRWFILQYENLLREIDCRVTVPYWDWSLVGADPFSSDVWHPGPHGMGGNGNGSENCVNTGPFREAVWSLVQSAGGGCLKRNFNRRAPDAMAVEALILDNGNATQFIDFEFLLRRAFHDLVHCVIGGTMCITDSASAPEFFLHHGFIDKIWWDWQKLSDAHKFNTYFVTQTDIMPGTVYRSKDFLDLNNQPGCVCAEYVNPRSAVYQAIKGLTKEQMQNIPRMALPSLSQQAVQLFKTTQKELHHLHDLMPRISPRKTMSKSELHGRDAKQGFKTADIMAKIKESKQTA